MTRPRFKILEFSNGLFCKTYKYAQEGDHNKIDPTVGCADITVSNLQEIRFDLARVGCKIGMRVSFDIEMGTNGLTVVNFSVCEKGG